MILLDTNAVLRYILNDISEQHKQVLKLIKASPAAIRLEVLVEVIYVLEKYYKKSRSEIANVVFTLGRTENLLIQYPQIIARVLQFYVEDKLDIVDCILCAFNNIEGHEVFTFDKKLKTLLRPKNPSEKKLS